MHAENHRDTAGGYAHGGGAMHAEIIHEVAGDTLP